MLDQEQEQKHVIYVSYADADRKWVIHLVSQLQSYLARQLGQIDNNFIWARYMLKRHENRSTVPQQHLQQSTYLLTVLSPAYIKTMNDSEINSFNNIDHIFVVECYETCRPEKLKHFEGYRFWHEDETKKVVRWADPKPNPDEREYYRLLDQMARDIAETINESKRIISPNTPAQPTLGICGFQPLLKVFINAYEDDITVAHDIRDKLGTDIEASVSPSPLLNLPPNKMRNYLKNRLLDCDAAIIICSQSPPTWVFEQIQFSIQMQGRRTQKGKPNIKLIAVFNRPPPDDLERHCGIKFNNLKIWDCIDIDQLDCIDKFKKAIL